MAHAEIDAMLLQVFDNLNITAQEGELLDSVFSEKRELDTLYLSLKPETEKETGY